MRYSRLIKSLIDECISASLGGYDVEDVIGHLAVNGDWIRERLIKTVIDPRFKSTVRPVSGWEDAAQDELEAFAGQLLQMPAPDDGAAKQMMDQFLTRFFFSMMQKTRSGSRSLPLRDGSAPGSMDGEEGEEEEGEEGGNAEQVRSGETDREDREKARHLEQAMEEMRPPTEGSPLSREDEKRIELRFLRSIPSSLVRLAKLIGRSGSYDAMPSGSFLTASKSDIAGITVGNDLNSLLPSEVALLAEPQTQDIFFRNYAEKRLQVFASASSSDADPVEHQDGPVIICLDTSGSMSGRPSQIAAALTMAVAIIAQRRHRKVLIVRYADNHHLFELKNLRRQRKDLLDFLTLFCDGGNDENEMFSWLFGTVLPKQGEFTSADVLCVSDFGWTSVNSETFKTIKEYKDRGMIFYGLDVTGKAFSNTPSFYGNEGAGPSDIIDSKWIWNEGRHRCEEKAR